MARIRIAATNAAAIPTPPANKATMFLDAADLSFKAKLPDGSLIPISATQEYIQDQFASFIQDSSTVNFTYDDSNNLAYLEVIQSALDIFQIPVTPTGNLTSNNVGDALNELQSSIDTTDQNFANHTDGGPSKHDATEVDYERADGSRNSIQAASDNVEAALSDLDDNKLARNGSQAMTGPLVLNADPTTDFQAATKRYVDNAIQGLAAKDAVKAATTVPGTLSSSFENGDVIDGVTLITGDRILIKNQTNPAENGIYTVNASGAPTRSTDADSYSELVSAFVFVEQGATQANTGWTSQAVSGGTLNTDPIPWVQFSSAGVVTTDGQGIERVGNELRLELDGPTLSKSGTGLKVADAQIGTTQLTDQGVTNGKVADNTLTDQKISPTAAIQHSKMAALTANRALQSDGSGVVTPSVVTATEQNQLQGVTSNIQTQLDNKTPISHLDGGASKHDATEVDYERLDGSKTSIQASSDDVESALSDLDDNKLARSGVQAMTGNLNMGTHDVTNVGLVDGRDVSVDGTKLDGIEPGATADQTASEVPVTPTGDISSTNVQAALAELDSEKVPKTTQVNAGAGLSGGGDLSVNRTISMPNVGTPGSVGSSSSVPVITTDAQGRVSAAVNTPISGVPAANITNAPAGNISSTNVQAALNELDAEKQPLDGDLTAISALAGTGLIARTATNTMAVRTIIAASGETTVSNGDGISGNPTIGLPDVGPGAGSVGATNSSLSLTTDAKGRVTARSASLISIVASQVSNFASTVLSTVLTGYAVGTSAALTATDTILEAFGKVQAQLNTLFARNINTGTGLQGGGNLTADRTLSLTNTGVVAGTYGDGLNVAQPTVDAQGRITAIVNVPITFGQDYQRFVDTVQSTSTSTANPVTAVASSFTTTNLPAGTYRVNLQFAWTHSVNTSDARFALYVDGVLVGSQMNVELSDATTNWVSQLLGGVTFGSAGTHTIELRFGSESGANTVTVNRVEADIWRVV